MMMMMMMQLFLLTLLITVKQSVTQNIITVDQVSVQQGKSIIIPCLYHADYIHYPKYLCFGTKYFCKDVKQLKNRMVSVSDNQTQHIFTATLKNVTTRDTGAYLCSVEIPGFKPKKSFQLKVTTATPELYVDDQIVTGYEGSHLLISCYHQTRKPNAWCKIGGPCVSTIGNISGASVQLRSTERGFKVTMSELSVDNSGWYWCSAGDQQMPVYISVQSAVPNWERMSFAWLILLELLLAVACMAVMVFRQHKQKCGKFSSRKISDNAYVSMKKPHLQTNQHEEDEAQDYEMMSSPEQSLGVQKMNPKLKVSPKTDGGPITNKDEVPEGLYCTC